MRNKKTAIKLLAAPLNLALTWETTLYKDYDFSIAIVKLIQKSIEVILAERETELVPLLLPFVTQNHYSERNSLLLKTP